MCPQNGARSRSPPNNYPFLPVMLHMEVWNKIWGYLTLRKPTEDEPTSFNLRMMHGINKISIFMFLIALIIMIVKLAT